MENLENTMDEKFKYVAVVDTDFYVINYVSTITTYIQNLCDNLVRDGKVTTTTTTTTATTKAKTTTKTKTTKTTTTITVTENKNSFTSEEYAMNKMKKRICLLMLGIFLKTMEKSVDLFPLLHKVLKKYHELITFRNKSRKKSGSGKRNKRVDNKNRDVDKKMVKSNDVAEKKQTKNEEVINEKVINEKVINEKVINEKVINEKVINEKMINEKDKENENENEKEKKRHKDELLLKNVIQNILIDLTKKDHYNNFINIKESKMCIAKLKNIDIRKKKKMVNGKYGMDKKKKNVENDTYPFPKNGTTKINDKKDENKNENKICVENKDENKICVENKDENKVCVENKQKYKETDYGGDQKGKENKKEELEGDSIYSTFKQNEAFLPPINEKRFVINYNKVYLKSQRFRHSADFLYSVSKRYRRKNKEVIKKEKTTKEKEEKKEKKEKEEVEDVENVENVEDKRDTKKIKEIKEVYFMYRILILSKLHIGAYNFLSSLKKKKLYCIFYSSNKKLTSFLFKWFNIKKNFRGCYRIVSSFEKIAKISEKKKCFIFSNRESFIQMAQKNGIFNVVSGRSNPNGKSGNCDDINWNFVKWENEETEKANRKETYDQSVKQTNEQNKREYTADAETHVVDGKDSSSDANISYSKYNSVVYPFLKNCNLTQDILSWQLFYVFKKFIFITGEVVKGFGRGSKYLNLPTANISNSDLFSGDIIPGIYFGFCKLRQKIYKTVISIGYNPYFKNTNMTIEAFIFYKTNDYFYKENIHLVIVGMLRSESNFAYFSHLIHAIQFDCEMTRIILKKMKNSKKVATCKAYLNSLK